MCVCVCVRVCIISAHLKSIFVHIQLVPSPAKRVVLLVADGLRADMLIGKSPCAMRAHTAFVHSVRMSACTRVCIKCSWKYVCMWETKCGY